MKRIKLTQPVITSRSEAETLVGEIADLMIQQRDAQNEMDAAITAIRAQFEGRFAALEKAIKEKTTVAQAWADANPAEFGPLKSINMVHAEIGYRTGMPTVKTLPGWSFDRVLEKLQELGWRDYIRTTDEVDKQALLAARTEISDTDLRNIGIRIVQSETFYIAPKLSDQSTPTVAAA